MAKVLSVQVRVGLCAEMRSVFRSLMISPNVVGEIYPTTMPQRTRITSLVCQHRISSSQVEFDGEGEGGMVLTRPSSSNGNDEWNWGSSPLL